MNDAGGGKRPRPARGALAVTGAAALLTLVMAAPVLVAPGARLFGREIAGRHHDPFTVIDHFERPRPLGLYTQPATDWAGAVAAWALGDGLRAYHLVVLASFPLAALFAFLYARRLTGSTLAAAAAALAYAFLPFHWAHAAYHPHGAQTQWLPLYLLALWLCVERLNARRAALLVAAAGLVALSNFYFGLIAAVLTPCALAAQWRLRPADGGPRPHRAAVGTGALLLALAGGGLAYVARFAAPLLGDRAALGFPAADVARYTARWWCYLVPPVDHPLGGAPLAAFWARQDPGGLVERQLTVGVGALALAAVALAGWWAGERGRLTRSVPVLALVGGVAYLFSMPPVWRLGPLAVPAPAGLLHRLLPMFRAHARFGLVVGLAVAVLAGIGLRRLWARGGRARAAALGLAALAAVELAPFPPWRWRDVLPTSAHRWIASSEAGEAVRVMDCVRRGQASEVGVGRFLGDAAGRLSRLPPGADCGDPQAADRFGGAGFSHLLVRRDSDLGRWLAGRPAPPGLERVGGFDDALLLRIAGEPAPLRAAIGAGFHFREYKPDASYRWMARAGRLDLWVGSPAPVTAALELELHAFPGPRQVAARLDGRELPTLAVAPERSTYRLPLGELAPGSHRLELEALAPATIPDEVLGNGDRRALTVALWGWSWVEPGGRLGRATPRPPGPRRSAPGRR